MKLLFKSETVLKLKRPGLCESPNPRGSHILYYIGDPRGLGTRHVLYLYRKHYVAIEGDNGKCEDVMRPLDGTFLTSSVGVWEGCTAFRNSKRLIGECKVLSAKDEKRGVYRH